MADRDRKQDDGAGEAVVEASAGAEDRQRSPAARRALAEAEERRRLYEAEAAARPKELGGRGGQDPQRYGDWEVKGLASDF